MSSPPVPGARRLRVVAALVFALALAAYANTLGHGLVLDDVDVVVRNDAAHDPLDWRRILLAPSWPDAAGPAVVHRPLTTWTFALHHALHGLQPLGYHLGNVLAHAAVSVLVLLLAVGLGVTLAVAAAAAALFAVHPIHTAAVAAVVGRADILAAGFGLLTLLGERRAAAGARAGLSSAGAALAYALALLSSEQAVALLVLVPLLDLVAVDGGSPRLFLRRLPGRRVALYAALLAITGGYLWLRATALGAVGGEAAPGRYWMNPAASAPAELRVLTALEVLARALWLLVNPFRLSADYSYRTIEVSASLADPGTLAGLAVGLGLVAAAAILWRRSGAAFFCLALAVATWAVVSNLVVPIGTLLDERLLYLPSVGFCALTGIALVRPAARPHPALVVAVLGLVATWGGRTLLRNPVWRSQLAIAEAMVVDAPASVRAHRRLGITLSELGRDEDALREFERALGVAPEDVTSLYNAGVVYQRRGQAVEALAVFDRATRIDPTYFPAWVSYASVSNVRGSFGPALGSADRAIALRPDHPNGYLVRGFALRGLERYVEARAAFESALERAPRMPEPLLGLGATAVDQQDWAAAASAFTELVRVAPVADAYRGLVHSHRQAGRLEDAARAAEEARQRFPDDPFFRP